MTQFAGETPWRACPSPKNASFSAGLTCNPLTHEPLNTMQIETYEIEDNPSEAATMAQDSEAIELCEKLGLTGQLKLTDKETDTRFPYPRMTAAQAVVYDLHCPIHTLITDYSSGIIPLRVLQVAAYLKEHPLCKRLEVWHPKDPKTDPLLVSWTATYGGDSYLCARWGDVLKPWGQLVEEAKPLWIAKTSVLLAQFASKIKGWQEALPQIADDVVLNGRDFTPNLFD